MRANAMAIRTHYITLHQLSLDLCQRFIASASETEELLATYMIKLHHVGWVFNATVGAWSLFDLSYTSRYAPLTLSSALDVLLLVGCVVLLSVRIHVDRIVGGHGSLEWSG